MEEVDEGRIKGRALALRMSKALQQLLRHHKLLARQVAKQTGLTPAQYLCLQAIRESPFPDLTLTVLATTLEMGPSTLSTLIERLVKAELVDRVRSTKDRRKVAIALTDKGRERVDSVSLREAFVDELSHIPSDQQEVLAAALEELAGLLK